MDRGKNRSGELSETTNSPERLFPGTLEEEEKEIIGVEVEEEQEDTDKNKDKEEEKEERLKDKKEEEEEEEENKEEEDKEEQDKFEEEEEKQNEDDEEVEDYEEDDYDDDEEEDELEPEFEQLQEDIHITLSSDLLPDNERIEKIRQQFEDFEKIGAFSSNRFIDRRLCNDFLKYIGSSNIEIESVILKMLEKKTTENIKKLFFRI
ncbi:MAG: hypothetical protein EZS28_018668 [Streblomastix strix]|uniref:Uncharacterized protein n=1 Tax=Streblomastix strix TaxID=222440 RepID=A0A5J4VT44_9EUKA|nr:MAG: hypothetical protein EZS28_018668 [Streblomastix strix]